MTTQAQPALEADDSAEKSAEIQVLVIDDDASILGIVSEVLEDEGYSVDTAGSGEDAMDMLAEKQYSLVLSDIRLPGMNGVEVLEHIKNVYPRTQVIMITSHASVNTSIDAIKHGAYDYLMKPFEELSQISNAAKRAIEAHNLEVERSQLIRSLKLSNKELARLNGVLHGMAVRDGLTDLFNHRYVNELLDKHIEKSSVEGVDLALIFIDVDKFKVFNDVHGHQNGDVLLRELSALMRENVRNKDIVARWGGEEFVIVSPNTKEKTAAMLADSLRESIAGHPFLKGIMEESPPVTISAGVAVISKFKNKAALVKAADGALYAAKNGGRNQIKVAS